MPFNKVEKYLLDLGFTVTSKNREEGFFVVESEGEGIKNLIIGVTAPIIIFEQYLFSLKRDNLDVFKALLKKNRDIIHGAFALTEDGRRVIFRYTLQAHNLDQNEFDAAINSLSLLMSEYYAQLIEFSKQ
ncbi:MULTISPECIES: YbjN domain-containing protein [unclassified Sphingobacterium]|uniref:YbjN domain-containing protein n=1 Tax=unclassified Sphingobacterium TaxID=2609468 RepID=UPI00265CA61E|nr:MULTISPECIES: YbjN domain-containing protein [unclassified Sphingobacterium]WKK59976.1 YbjN domain-containing protein [Sphingobacterium sp. BN32]